MDVQVNWGSRLKTSSVFFLNKRSDLWWKLGLHVVLQNQRTSMSTLGKEVNKCILKEKPVYTVREVELLLIASQISVCKLSPYCYMQSPSNWHGHGVCCHEGVSILTFLNFDLFSLSARRRRSKSWWAAWWHRTCKRDNHSWKLEQFI